MNNVVIISAIVPMLGNDELLAEISADMEAAIVSYAGDFAIRIDFVQGVSFENGEKTLGVNIDVQISNELILRVNKNNFAGIFHACLEDSMDKLRKEFYLKKVSMNMKIECVDNQ